MLQRNNPIDMNEDIPADPTITAGVELNIQLSTHYVRLVFNNSSFKECIGEIHEISVKWKLTVGDFLKHHARNAGLDPGMNTDREKFKILDTLAQLSARALTQVNSIITHHDINTFAEQLAADRVLSTLDSVMCMTERARDALTSKVSVPSKAVRVRKPTKRLKNVSQTKPTEPTPQKTSHSKQEPNDLVPQARPTPKKAAQAKPIDEPVDQVSQARRTPKKVAQTKSTEPTPKKSSQAKPTEGLKQVVQKKSSTEAPKKASQVGEAPKRTKSTKKKT
ncbi:hypothetical protein DFH27DRAFT_528996 [Peziza echinospora]|nr:hypothetical protein DFH27DRAFT_528996 [Peziza echinospora]